MGSGRRCRVWLATLIAGALSAPVMALDWQVRTVLADAAPHESSPIVLDASGAPLICYDDHEKLMYSRWDGSAWRAEVAVPTGPNFGAVSLALDAAGEPHVCFTTREGLSYAYRSAGQWRSERVELPYAVADLSIGVGAEGCVYLTYWIMAANQQGFACRSQGKWETGVLDAGGGGYPDLAACPTGLPQVLYSRKATVQYAFWTGTSWTLSQVVDRRGGGHSDIAVDAQGRPRISYHYADRARDGAYVLCYAAWNGATWDVEQVGSAPESAEWTSLAVDGQGNPHIPYYHRPTQSVRYARGLPGGAAADAPALTPTTTPAPPATTPAPPRPPGRRHPRPAQRRWPRAPARPPHCGRPGCCCPGSSPWPPPRLCCRWPTPWRPRTETASWPWRSALTARRPPVAPRRGPWSCGTLTQER